MSSVSLYIACVLIWGSTWLAITFQLGQVPPAVSVAYRFALASVMLLAYCVVRWLPMRYTLRDHAWMALQGFLLFGANYVLVYLSEAHISSGLTAVIFSSMAFWNILGVRYFYATPLRPAALIGAALGVLGVAMVFAPELTIFSKDGSGMLGLGYGLAATLCASLGNITAARNQRHGLPVVQQNAFGMLYGALLVTLFALLTGERFVFESTVSYILSLLYLALFGSVLAFGGYLTLLGRIGADRAGYVSVAIPIVAVLLSTLFEGFRWHPATVLGIALCVLGNVLVLRKKKP
ncbi:MAG TPA: EamA family transporter [Acidiferrobacterales bacterium]|nr:EamA family transporter [Acidiferrobacterales bacterium]